MWLLYQIAIALGLVVAGPFLLASRGRHYLKSLPVRLGRRYQASAGPPPVWIHAVSVGEAGVATTLIRKLPEEWPLVVTTVTPTGQELAETELAPLADRTRLTYLPFELGFAVRRFFDRLRPRALILVEGDLWPLVLRRARHEKLPIVVVNGRVSDRSFARMRRLRHLLGPILEPVHRFAVQTATDGERLAALGVPPEKIEVTGNLKFDTPEARLDPQLEARLRGLADGRPIVAAGSTMRGEEEAVLEAFHTLGGGGRALLLLAPRHPERWPEVRRLLQSSGLDVAARSALPDSGRPDVLLLDSLGELAGVYRVADVAFIGGTLVPTGGHNPLEAARFGVPVAVGPSMENFRAIAEEFDRSEAWERVAGAGELAATWGRWLAEPKAAQARGAAGARIVAANRGALERTLAIVRRLVPNGGNE